MRAEPFQAGSLWMRPLTEVDKGFYVGLYTCPRTMRHIGEPLGQVDAEQAFARSLQAADDGRMLQWVLRDTEAGYAVGLLSLRPQADAAEFGLMLASDSRHGRMAIEAVDGLTRHVFGSTPLTWLEARHRATNRAAGQVMGALGYYQRSRQGDEVYWRLDATSWQALAERRDFKGKSGWLRQEV